MTYREFFSHVVDVVEAVGATILVFGGPRAFARYAYEAALGRGACGLGDLRKNCGRGAFPRKTPGWHVTRWTMNRQVGALLLLALTLGLVLAAVGYSRFTDVKDEVYQATERFEPADRALTTAQEHWTKASQAFADLAG